MIRLEIRATLFDLANTYYNPQSSEEAKAHALNIIKELSPAHRETALAILRNAIPLPTKRDKLDKKFEKITSETYAFNRSSNFILSICRAFANIFGRISSNDVLELAYHEACKFSKKPEDDQNDDEESTDSASEKSSDSAGEEPKVPAGEKSKATSVEESTSDCESARLANKDFKPPTAPVEVNSSDFSDSPFKPTKIPSSSNKLPLVAGEVEMKNFSNRGRANSYSGTPVKPFNFVVNFNQLAKEAFEDQNPPRGRSNSCSDTPISPINISVTNFKRLAFEAKPILPPENVGYQNPNFPKTLEEDVNTANE